MALNNTEDKIILFKSFNTHYLIWRDKVAALKPELKYLSAEIARRALCFLILFEEIT